MDGLSLGLRMSWAWSSDSHNFIIIICRYVRIQFGALDSALGPSDFLLTKTFLIVNWTFFFLLFFSPFQTHLSSALSWVTHMLYYKSFQSYALAWIDTCCPLFWMLKSTFGFLICVSKENPPITQKGKPIHLIRLHPK